MNNVSITVGELEPSGAIALKLHPLPPTVIDDGWVIPYVVSTPSGWFGGLAFPAVRDGKTLVGIIALSSNIPGAIPDSEMFGLFAQSHEQVRSQVLQKWSTCWNNYLDVHGVN